jgi:hypothetical protein
MAVFRVPYPKEQEQRQALFERVGQLLTRFGSCEGTTEGGTFQGSTPIGGFHGEYRVIEESAEMEVVVFKKPFLVPMSRIESVAREFVSQF